MKQPAILIVAAGFVAGVAAASWLSVPVALGTGLAVAVLLLKRVGGKAALLLVLAATLGVWRIAASPLAPPDGGLAPTSMTAATGTVIGFPHYTDGRQQAVIDLAAEGRTGNVLVTLEPYPPLKPGDIVSFEGSLKEPKVFPDFDYRKYLAKDGIHVVAYNPDIEVTGHRHTLDRMVYPLRDAFLNRLGKLYPEPVAGFLSAILMGERSGLPEELQESFRQTGTVHVMALSGYNISILITAVVAILGRKRSVLWVSFLIIFAFVMMVGPSPSVVRAALMGSFLLLGQMLGRPQLAMLACVVTAAAMLAYNPWSLRYDLGFDLSFLATLGILAWEEPVRQRLGWLHENVRGIVSATISASLPTAPLIALTFGTVSLISPVANVVVVPTIPWLMLGAFVSALVGFVLMPLASLLAVVVGLVTHLVLTAVELMATVPGASLTMTGFWPLVATGIGLFACVVMLRLRKSHA